jgi:alanyl-tRNA synthetase
VVPGDRKTLIEIANQVLDINPSLTVILANQAGDVVCMSRTKDAVMELKSILEKSGGSGGGSKGLAQGRLELSKLMKLIEKG